MKVKAISTILILFLATNVFAQPFADILTFSYQTFNGTYNFPTDSTFSYNGKNAKNKTDNYVLNFFLPKEFKNGNTFLLRLNTESINSTISPDTSYSYRLSAISLPVE